MTFTVSYSARFAAEFARFPSDQQDRVIAFAELFERHGLSDATKYPGKLSPSWLGLQPINPTYQYAYSNNLWHYHVGIPYYRPTNQGYSTSEWVLHFQWVKDAPHIDLVDLYEHYLRDGRFYLPPVNALAKPASTPDQSNPG